MTHDEIVKEVFDRDQKLRRMALEFIVQNIPVHGNRTTLRALQLCFIAGYETAKFQMNSLEKPNNSNGWISTSYALPEIGKAVLVTHRTSEDYDNLSVMEASRLDDDQYGIADDAAILACYVDYWMPLPKPPR